MGKKKSWILPIDDRLIPNIISFKYPKSPWVRLFLAVEMFFALVALVGTLFIVLLPPSFRTQNVSKATQQESPQLDNSNY